MASPSSRSRKQRKGKPGEIRTAQVLGKEYRDVAYRPQFALGIHCSDETDQQQLFSQLSTRYPQHDIKVLVI